jgi:hypothetical protein
LNKRSNVDISDRSNERPVIWLSAQGGGLNEHLFRARLDGRE